jgi:hypothetical protein
MPLFCIKLLQLSLSGFVGAVAVSNPTLAQSAPLTQKVTQNNGYIGIGSAIGLGGNTTALGTGGVAILTKVRFSDRLSLHDATVLFGSGGATSMIIVSADFPIRNDAGQTVISPFIGGGAMLRFAGGLSISPAVSGGIDLPLSKDFTGTLRLNAGFPNNRAADVGLLIGAGYNFGS